jgi:hypothetical protein
VQLGGVRFIARMSVIRAHAVRTTNSRTLPDQPPTFPVINRDRSRPRAGGLDNLREAARRLDGESHRVQRVEEQVKRLPAVNEPDQTKALQVTDEIQTMRWVTSVSGFRGTGMSRLPGVSSCSR